MTHDAAFTPSPWRRLNLDPQILRLYRKNGFAVIPNILPAKVTDALRCAVDRQFARRFQSASAYDFQKVARQVFDGKTGLDLAAATRFDMSAYCDAVRRDPGARLLPDPEGDDPATDGEFFYDAAGWRTHREIREAALDSILGDIAAALLDSVYVNFWEDTTFVKTPGATQRTAFHQDKGYFQITGNKCCILWAPLDPVDRENGALQYIRASHRWNAEFAPNAFFAGTPLPGAPTPRLPDIEADPDAYEIVTTNANVGDVVAHHVLTVHGAAGNSSDRNRRAISFRYCGDDVRYAAKPAAIPQIGLTTTPDEGSPLYSRDYPLVWPRAFPEARLSPLYEIESANVTA
jgi:ectoine hydroxylase-related dioxygenase (phytanoyl-CoA dioxygenase family)